MILINNIEAHSCFKFPGQELHVRVNHTLIDSYEPCDVYYQWQGAESLLELQLLVDALRSMGYTLGSLHCPYLPAARQDRIAVLGEALSVRVIIGILDGLGFKEALVDDVHSDVSLMWRATPVYNREQWILANQFLPRDYWKDCVIVSPDAGARKKTDKFIQAAAASSWGLKLTLVEGSKVRDPVTGNLSGFRVDQPELVKDRKVLILDDICDAGGTFIGLADKLLEHGATEVALYVTHGIFSKGLGPFEGRITKLFCFHAWKGSTNRVGYTGTFLSNTNFF